MMNDLVEGDGDVMTMLQRCMDYYTLWQCNVRLYHASYVGI